MLKVWSLAIENLLDAFNLEETGHVLWDWLVKKEGWSSELCRWLSLLHPVELIGCVRDVVNETRGKPWWLKI